MLAGKLPVGDEFIPVHRSPFNYERLSFRGEPSVKNPKRPDHNLRFILAIFGVEMGWIVVVKKHFDPNPVEF